jgi:hypothetical protein
MEKTEAGTTVGVDDPYAHVDRCDHLTDDGRCRFALEQSSMSPGSQARQDAVEQGDRDPEFADARSREDFQCPVAGDPTEQGPTGPWDWADCSHFRCRNRDRECIRCGLEEVRLAHDDARPLLEEHHLSYADESTGGEGTPGHEITVYLCRWCHAKVHDSWARVDDDASPDPEAIAEKEGRRSKEQEEMGFESAADRYDAQ